MVRSTLAGVALLLAALTAPTSAFKFTPAQNAMLGSLGGIIGMTPDQTKAAVAARLKQGQALLNNTVNTPAPGGAGAAGTAATQTLTRLGMKPDQIATLSKMSPAQLQGFAQTLQNMNRTDRIATGTAAMAGLTPAQQKAVAGMTTAQARAAVTGLTAQQGQLTGAWANATDMLGDANMTDMQNQVQNGAAGMGAAGKAGQTAIATAGLDNGINTTYLNSLLTNTLLPAATAAVSAVTMAGAQAGGRGAATGAAGPTGRKGGKGSRRGKGARGTSSAASQTAASPTVATGGTTRCPECHDQALGPTNAELRKTNSHEDTGGNSWLVIVVIIAVVLAVAGFVLTGKKREKVGLDLEAPHEGESITNALAGGDAQ